MSKLVVTNIQVSRTELKRYRQLAHAEGVSLSQFIRAVVSQYTHQLLVSGKVDVRQIAVQQPREAESMWWQAFPRFAPVLLWPETCHNRHVRSNSAAAVQFPGWTCSSVLVELSQARGTE